MDAKSVIERAIGALSRAKEILAPGAIADCIRYYTEEMHRNEFLLPLNHEVLSQLLSLLNLELKEVHCRAESESHDDADACLSFDIHSDLLGKIGRLELLEGELTIRAESIGKLLKGGKGLNDLDRYAKHLRELEKTVAKHGFKMAFY